VDNGVPFAFVDKAVRSSFTYFYAVTAFDINSVKSGPSSLESPLITKTVTPRAPSGQEVSGTLTPNLLGEGGVVLAKGTVPAIDPTTGEFAGPMPPADGWDVGLAAFVPQLLADGSASVTIDSVVPGSAFASVNTPVAYYVTATGAGAPVKTTLSMAQDASFSGVSANDATASVNFVATTLSNTQSGRFGGDSTYQFAGKATVIIPGAWRTAGWGRADANAFPASSAQNGPRWWDGATNETTSGPTSGNCAPSVGTCGNTTAVPDVNKTAGALSNVTGLMHVAAYNTVPSVPARDFEGITGGVVRAADFKVYWGAAGAVDSVVDVTHQLPVPFSPVIRATWGFLTGASFAGAGTPAAGSTDDGNNNLLTWQDVFCVAPAPLYMATDGDGSAGCGGTASPAPLKNTATLSPIAISSSAFQFKAAVATGNGFIFYLNGHFFLMQMAALPAAGTVWNARFYSGAVTGTAAAGNYAFVSATRPPAVPGLTLAAQYTGSKLNIAATDTTLLANIHTVPDPYYATNALEISPNKKVLKFVNLPGQCIVRIYSLSGVLIQVLTHNDVQGGGELTWDLRNRNSQFVASGVYFYHVETADGKSKTGRFTVVNFAQ
jgi:hypothetical protein